MFADQKRWGKDPSTVTRTTRSVWNKPRAWNTKASFGEGSLVLGGTQALAFTCSWSDFFIEEADAWRAEAWEIIRSTPNVTYQILTKRPERIKECLPPDWGDGYANVWLGVSVETEYQIVRLQQLHNAADAVVRFVSFEPLLEPIGMDKALAGRIDWAIIGGESGPNYRKMSERAVVNLAHDLTKAGVPVFFKQKSAVKPGQPFGIAWLDELKEFPV